MTDLGFKNGSSIEFAEFGPDTLIGSHTSVQWFLSPDFIPPPAWQRPFWWAYYRIYDLFHPKDRIGDDE